MNAVEQLILQTAQKDIQMANAGMFGSASEAVALKNQVLSNTINGVSSGNLPSYTGNGSVYDQVIAMYSKDVPMAVNKTVSATAGGVMSNSVPVAASSTPVYSYSTPVMAAAAPVATPQTVVDATVKTPVIEKSMLENGAVVIVGMFVLSTVVSLFRRG